MQRIAVGLGERTYDVIVGAGVLDELAPLRRLQPSSMLVVTDENVAPLWGRRLAERLAAVAPTTSCELPAGEANKTLGTVQQVLDALVERGADRRSVVVAVGGGVVGDMAGFAAAVFMRGIRFVQVPTTLLAQVDSSVGGKTGVNHALGKNLIGAFHQPTLVLADTRTLSTLPPRELAAGLAEVLKHGLLADAAYFAETEAALPRLRAGEPDALAAAVAGSCRIKAGVVARDEREQGERALLNLGHTFGHAIETLTGYSRWLHGEAVGCGICLAADLSQRLGLLAPPDVERVAQAVAAAGLPTRIAGLPLAAAQRAMRGDKKAVAGSVRYILLERIGRAIQRAVPDDAVAATLLAGGFLAEAP
jgi:3-dehydroquinate synthase